MALRLATIRFNHNLSGATTSAMNIRRNKDFEVTLPEYRAAAPLPLEQTGVAYAIAETTNQQVVIQVSMLLSEPAPKEGLEYEIRATGGGLLGALDPINATFEAGTSSTTLTIPLNNRVFAEVTRQDMAWQWESRRTPAEVWVPLVTTRHRVYLLLAIPPAPWDQTYASKKNPWTDLLDASCLIAQGTRDAVSATRNLVQALHRNYGLKYDIVGGEHAYEFRRSGSAFNLTHWIDYVLQGHAPATPLFCPGSADEGRRFLTVNCYDMTASLALMAQVLGVAASYHYHSPFGQLNYVRPIGRGRANNPFYGCGGAADAAMAPDALRQGFSDHTYVKINGRNFDTCLRYDVTTTEAAQMTILWFLLLCMTLGLVNAAGLLDRANGWLIDLPQADYEARIIDRSTPREAGEARDGGPMLEVLDFSVA